MKKAALSLFVIAASGAYVLSQSGGATNADILGPALDPVQTSTSPGPTPAPAPSLQTTSFIVDAPVAPKEDRAAVATPPPAPQPPEPPPLPIPATEAATLLPAEAPPLPAAPAVSQPVAVDIPVPRARPAYEAPANRLLTRTATRVAAAFGMVDGTYTGPVVDAYYGLIQIQAIVQDGRLAGIKVLQFPSDRRTSVFINRQALPMLRDEVVSAQTANVDIISGATLTSEAFIRSLDGALRQARA
jgi:uncharacterized protein with FMN-binding domain